MARFRKENAELLEAKGIYSLPAFAKERAYLSEAQMRRVIKNKSLWPEYGIYGARKVGAGWLIATSQSALDELMALAPKDHKAGRVDLQNVSLSEALVVAQGLGWDIPYLTDYGTSPDKLIHLVEQFGQAQKEGRLQGWL